MNQHTDTPAARHSRERGNPSPRGGMRLAPKAWTPAFAGVTAGGAGVMERGAGVTAGFASPASLEAEIPPIEVWMRCGPWPTVFLHPGGVRDISRWLSASDTTGKGGLIPLSAPRQGCRTLVLGEPTRPEPHPGFERNGGKGPLSGGIACAQPPANILHPSGMPIGRLAFPGGGLPRHAPCSLGSVALLLEGLLPSRLRAFALTPPSSLTRRRARGGECPQ